jgi:hypothetical protein
MDVRSTRRANFQILLREVWQNKRVLVAEDLGYESPNMVTKMLAEAGSKSEKAIGHQLARKVERAARERGADWVLDGWLDVPHEGTLIVPRANKRGTTIEERIAALPEPLRNYLLLELDLCERIEGLAAIELLRTPTAQNRTKFQAYLEELARQLPASSRKTAA